MSIEADIEIKGINRIFFYPEVDYNGERKE